MPKVPDNILPMAPRQPTVPVSQTTLAMAAGMMHAEGRLFEQPDYDYAGAKAAGVVPDDRGHLPDTYKLPNHITFSDESKHNDGGAGHWEKVEGQWSFTPGPTNLKYHSIDAIRNYFKRYEPESILIEPQQDAIKGKNS